MASGLVQPEPGLDSEQNDILSDLGNTKEPIEPLTTDQNNSDIDEYQGV